MARASTASLPPRSVAQYTVALNVFGFFAVALLSGSLAEALRSAGARLEQASTEIADLQALNQHVIDSLPSGLATTDTRSAILTFNRAAETITGVLVPRRSSAAPSPTCCSCRRSSWPRSSADSTKRRARRVEFRYRPPTAAATSTSG